ncbi:hypothetical protein BCV70DRAFT_203131 [Testicularia cyperi]|uniref:Uncharacterized protein n=1 Tax=Testicularia cyperi TaxID=1882483 RepID=A0A317XH39_9BASI|nr:hypothetical protein BCV70DRAFT_203131 [Testicularia cyperi]
MKNLIWRLVSSMRECATLDLDFDLLLWLAEYVPVLSAYAAVASALADVHSKLAVEAPVHACVPCQ